MNTLLERARESAHVLRSKLPAVPSVAVILGSGLGGAADAVEGSVSLTASAVPHFPPATVQGHAGRLVFRPAGGGGVLFFQGRRHYYECADVAQVVFPVFLAHALGAQTLLLTNAAGGVSRGLEPGDLMVISDQINLTGRYPPYPAGTARREPGRVYSEELIASIEGVGRRLGIPLKRGVYCGLLGPTYETAAEVEYIHRIGGDAVGMSTVLEAEAGADLGLRIGGISLVTNFGTGIRPARLSHDHVTAVAGEAAASFTSLLQALLPALL